MNNLLLLFSRKKQIKYENELGESSGIIFMDSPCTNRENVALMLAIKAFVVFLTLMGSLDCYMSGFGIDYDYGFSLLVCAVVSVIFTAANTKLVLTATVYAGCIYYISNYINTNFGVILSGATAVVNMSYKLIMEKYKFPSVDGFEELIADRGITIPALILMGALIMGMILAFFICRFMNIMLITIITMLPLGAVLFFEGAPSYGSFAMLVGAWLITAMVKFSSKFGHIRLKRRMNAYYFKDKIYYKQMCDGTAMVQAVFLLTLVAVIAAVSIYGVFSQAAFDSVVKKSKTKQNIDYAVRDTMITAFSSYKNYKLSDFSSGGQLGFYGNNQPDFETDLKITLVPYTTDRIYLRSYIGSEYKYKDNRWDNKEEKNAYVNRYEASATARAVKDSGVSAKININNIAVITPTGYMPYYTSLDESDDFNYVQDDIISGGLGLGQNTDVTYYPIINGRKVEAEISPEYKVYVYNNYLQVPEQLKLRLNSLCSGQGFRDNDELDLKINNFFQNNYEYNLQSGRLPWQTDFAEYFLFESKSGVCAHFATAATLLYRSVGIPARYVEGYCADYPQIMSGEAKEEYNTEDWLTGTAPLSKNVMEAELSDYNAHAWVEVYRDGVGWVTVDPTPYVDPDTLQTKAEETDLFEALLEYFGNAQLNDKGNDKRINAFIDILVVIVKLVILIVIASLLYFIAIRPVMWHIIRQKASNKKAVGLSFAYLKNLAVFCGTADNYALYRDLYFSLLELNMDKESVNTLLRLTEKSLYSKNGITNEELKALLRLMKNAKRLILRSASLQKRILSYFVIVK